MIHKLLNLNQKNSKTVATSLCLGSKRFSNDFYVDNMKNTGLNVYVYDFSVFHDFIAVDYILDIHKY